MKLFQFLMIIVLCGLFAANIFSQTAPSNDWARLTNGEISIEMPSGYVSFFDKDGFSFSDFSDTYNINQVQMIHAAADKISMSLEIYKISSPKKYLRKMLDAKEFKNDKNLPSPEGFIIKQSEQKKVRDFASKKDLEVSHVTRFIASQTNLYVITAASRGARSKEFERFFSSIRLNQPNDPNAVNIANLKSLRLEDIGEIVQPKPDDKKPSVITQTPKPVNPTPLIILTKPNPRYTLEARQYNITGDIRLRVTFSKDGRVSKIGIVSDLPGGLTRNAFFSALQMKFIPEEKDGEPTTITKTIEYKFSIY